ncbi:hypothetical protein A2Z00_04710 [Candidatus Gottesmanbacteria bacterium RBG_13_45_10]|uniref:UDP-N-acetyl-alpha-D-muramoyl-L-alanyl-L-glutamate epimerase n=1 Tax=Candidatus Gottesmanbacteria bacterium RBG_13_45_10 TaxID=1798370 RepID=A0A1F5ZG43_9BACT|nr:MAG: hypothetical protein A2Z00_04710 [Candidatus Gottesmanbacteria bacterium RBG_13_45_10]
MKTIQISTAIEKDGFRTTVDNHHLSTHYASAVWKSVPTTLHQQLAQTASYFFTRHLAVSKKTMVDYHFPPPMARLFLDYGYFYSIIEAPFEFPEKKLTATQVIRSAYNAEFFLRFRDIPEPVANNKPFSTNPHSCLMPISFGKDSLLTFALARELGLTPHPVFIVEPACPYQNKKKEFLRQEFSKEFGVPIIAFPNTLGELRQAGGMMWGWDMLLTQYTTLLLPYVFYEKPNYFFWSNEQSINEYNEDDEGYLVNPVHEQSIPWVLHLNNLYRLFGVNTTISSLIGPLHELLILSILHKRYPQVGKYQLSCDGEKTKHRWCGKCFECARIFLFLSAIGVDPKRIGLMDNMLAKKCKPLYYLFSKTNDPDLNILSQSYEERLLAFYLAYRRGVKGDLMHLFVNKLLPYVEKRKTRLFAKFFSIHSMETIPLSLQPGLQTIYKEELTRLKKDII